MTIQVNLRAFFRSLDPKMALRRKMRRDRMKKFYSYFVKRDDLCFDVGANVGNRTEIFLSLGATVISVEPQPLCLEALRSKFGKNPRVILQPSAVGEMEGTAEMLISNATTLSSLSEKWIAAVKESGRFTNERWEKKISVPVVTLDSLMERFGRPSFVKVDVEGYEEQVVKGLSKSVGAMSLEFTTETREESVHCIRHLERIGRCECNLSYGESLRFEYEKWQTPDEMVRVFEQALTPGAQGDLYVRFV